jgi:hypothetical protein
VTHISVLLTVRDDQARHEEELTNERRNARQMKEGGWVKEREWGNIQFICDFYISNGLFIFIWCEHKFNISRINVIPVLYKFETVTELGRTEFG